MQLKFCGISFPIIVSMLSISSSPTPGIKNVTTNAGSCKRNLGLVKYAVILEILEVGAAAYSDARNVSYKQREAEIRSVFAKAGVALGFVYCTVAAYNHGAQAHREDKFFVKPEGKEEYELVATRRGAWRKRVKAVLAALTDLRDRRANETVWLGH